MQNTILIAEDEQNLRRLVASYLLKEGFSIVEATDGREAYQQFFTDPARYCLLVLDIMMPQMDGYELLRAVREVSSVPVLFLTARDTESDELLGFGLGADEYIAKPFSPSILVTRIKNLLRRTQSGNLEDLCAGPIFLSYTQRAVTVEGKPVSLTPKEFDLLYYLLQNRNRVLTRSMILSSVWGNDYEGEDRTVDTHIKCLRAKLGPGAALIETVRKVGYKLAQT